MFAAIAAVLVATVIATGFVLKFLRRHAIVDRPNERSSHSGLTPRGGGIAVIAVLAVAWVFLAPEAYRNEIYTVAVTLLVLAGVSWIDDLRSLSPGIRLVVQLTAILPMIYWLSDKASVFQNVIPTPFDLVLAGVIWIWFINLFNFMDGIDGISGVEAASIGGGIALIATFNSDTGIDPSLAAAVSAAAVGFLCWNWHPAKIFLGDVGSVPLGYLLGWLLLNLASGGAWAAAVILPLYYLTDATITLARRALRGEKVWQAHREHFYQRAVQNGRSHATVSLCVAFCNVILIALAMLSVTWPWIALTGAAAVVLALLVWMSK